MACLSLPHVNILESCILHFDLVWILSFPQASDKFDFEAEKHIVMQIDEIHVNLMSHIKYMVLV